MNIQHMKNNMMHDTKFIEILDSFESNDVINAFMKYINYLNDNRHIFLEMIKWNERYNYSLIEATFKQTYSKYTNLYNAWQMSIMLDDRYSNKILTDLYIKEIDVRIWNKILYYYIEDLYLIIHTYPNLKLWENQVDNILYKKLYNKYFQRKWIDITDIKLIFDTEFPHLHYSFANMSSFNNDLILDCLTHISECNKDKIKIYKIKEITDKLSSKPIDELTINLDSTLSRLYYLNSQLEIAHLKVKISNTKIYNQIYSSLSNLKSIADNMMTYYYNTFEDDTIHWHPHHYMYFITKDIIVTDRDGLEHNLDKYFIYIQYNNYWFTLKCYNLYFLNYYAVAREYNLNGLLKLMSTNQLWLSHPQHLYVSSQWSVCRGNLAKHIDHNNIFKIDSYIITLDSLLKSSDLDNPYTTILYLTTILQKDKQKELIDDFKKFIS